MRALKVVREAGVRRVVAQRGLEPVSRRPPLRDEPANGYPVTRDDHGLTMLDCIEDVGEGPCRLRSSYRDHEYILSDLVCLCVYSRSQGCGPGLSSHQRRWPAAGAARRVQPRRHPAHPTQPAPDNPHEAEADSFSRDTLIPRAEAKELPSLKTLDDVRRFADRIGIAPGIIVGRLQHDSLWPHSQGNQLKRQLSFPRPADE